METYLKSFLDHFVAPQRPIVFDGWDYLCQQPIERRLRSLTSRSLSLVREVTLDRREESIRKKKLENFRNDD
jgi:hypothetical protein